MKKILTLLLIAIIAIPQYIVAQQLSPAEEKRVVVENLNRLVNQLKILDVVYDELTKDEPTRKMCKAAYEFNKETHAFFGVKNNLSNNGEYMDFKEATPKFWEYVGKTKADATTIDFDGDVQVSQEKWVKILKEFVERRKEDAVKKGLKFWFAEDKEEDDEDEDDDDKEVKEDEIPDGIPCGSGRLSNQCFADISKMKLKKFTSKEIESTIEQIIIKRRENGDNTIKKKDVMSVMRYLYKLLDDNSREKRHYHLFGHIHANHGIQKIGQTTFVNSAIMNEMYEFVNKPKLLEI